MIMNYEEMSNFEINSAVAKIEFPEHKQIITADNLDGVSSTVIMSKPISETGTEKHYLDYCSCPDNAWSIIVDNMISIQWYKNDCGAYFSASGSTEDESNKLYVAGDESPLRAAMICFLKMKDSECKN